MQLEGFGPSRESLCLVGGDSKLFRLDQRTLAVFLHVERLIQIFAISDGLGMMKSILRDLRIKPGVGAVT